MAPGGYRPETVVFVLDVVHDPGSSDDAKAVARLELLKQAIHMFAQAKSRVNPHHKYGLAVIRDTVQWEGPGLTASPEGLASALRGVQPFPTAPAAALAAAAASAAYGQPLPPPPPPPPPLELGSVLALVQPVAVAEEADGARVRVLLVYGRSTVMPTWRLHRTGLNLPVDVVNAAAVAAAAAAAGNESCPTPQDVYTWLEDNVDELSQRAGHSAYILESGSHLAKKVTALMVCLIAHPSQRPLQRHLRTSPLDLAAMPPQPTAASAADAAAAYAPPPPPPAAAGPTAGPPGAPARPPPPIPSGPAVTAGAAVKPSVPPSAAVAAAASAPVFHNPLAAAAAAAAAPLHTTSAVHYPLPPPAAAAAPPPAAAAGPYTNLIDLLDLTSTPDATPASAQPQPSPYQRTTGNTADTLAGLTHGPQEQQPQYPPYQAQAQQHVQQYAPPHSYAPPPPPPAAASYPQAPSPALGSQYGAAEYSLPYTPSPAAVPSWDDIGPPPPAAADPLAPAQGHAHTPGAPGPAYPFQAG
ncbi:hypothetical protein HYH03_016518 [Edaphochlamys debaryana]|uniref:Uncharacterized protein n=1 Tax=Edaphochlamys debaryana TaxID=47281 RepID=A0A836BRD3_9CHLO|nr:hypothetical protein HYH03_016518 [Edaphochlamys debaryana]|eukprot:KAG2484689.1 hypothetical protein HYH03_016518 [Edaphochlamys debaryana]